MKDDDEMDDMRYAVPFENNGFCSCCDNNVKFTSQNEWYRDHYKCNTCGCIPRERAIMHVIETEYPNWKQLVIHESSPGSSGASLKLKKYAHAYIASQFYRNRIELGSIVDGFRNEDLSNQTFEDECFDLIITQDVLEHVYNAENVFKEIERTLRPGGAHIFTVPFINKSKPTEKTAELDSDGNIVYHTPPVYHGNPIDSKGSLVTYHWGYDMVNLILRSSNMVSTIHHIDNLDLGIRAEFIEVVVSRKL